MWLNFGEKKSLFHALWFCLCFVISLRWRRAQMMTPPTYILYFILLPCTCGMCDDRSASTFRTELETRKQNANSACLKTVTALEPDSRSSSVYPDLRGWSLGLSHQLTEGTEGCWRETCGSNNIRATKEKVGPIGCFIRVWLWTGGRLSCEQCGRYRAQPTISTEACPLEWCSKHAGWPQLHISTLPHLQHLYLWKVVLCWCSYCTEEESFFIIRKCQWACVS